MKANGFIWFQTFLSHKNINMYIFKSIFVLHKNMDKMPFFTLISKPIFYILYWSQLPSFGLLKSESTQVYSTYLSIFTLDHRVSSRLSTIGTKYMYSTSALNSYVYAKYTQLTKSNCGNSFPRNMYHGPLRDLNLGPSDPEGCVITLDHGQEERKYLKNHGRSVSKSVRVKYAFVD